MKFLSFFRIFASLAVIVAISAPLSGQKKKRPDLLAILEVSRDEVICFALYTVHEKTLKLTAQLYPLKEGEDRKARLEVKQDGKWTQVAETTVIEKGWTAPFRVEKWDDTKETPYRVRHGEQATYEGIVRKNPVDKREFVVVGFTGNAGQVNYSSSKSAVIGFTKSIAKELGSRNITSNAVAPGFIETDMTRTGRGDSYLIERAKTIPLQRNGAPMDIAYAAAWLVSDEADYMTGQVISPNGGCVIV